MTDRRRTGLWAVLTTLALVATACSGGAPASSGTIGPTPASSGPATPGSSTPAPAIKTPKGWRTFSYLAITFAYPPLPGSVQEASEGETGPRHAWTIKRSDRCDPRGTCRSYEFAAVNDGCPGTEGWPTFAHRWKDSSGKYSISSCDGGDSFEITPLRIVTRPDGLHGVIYDANEWFPKGQKIDGALAAVLNFPKGFHKRYEAIAFYFEDPTPLDTIATVLRLVKLDT